MEAELAQSRLGKFTASVAHTVMVEKPGSVTLRDLCKDLAWERVHGATEEGFKSAAMRRGNELEERALLWYAFQTDSVPVRPTKTIDHPSIPWVAATPDALRHNPDRPVEAKCLLHKAYMDFRERREVFGPYRWQTQWQLWVTGLTILDFVVWHPKAGGFIIEVWANEEDQEAMRAKVRVAELMVQNWIEVLK